MSDCFVDPCLIPPSFDIVPVNFLSGGFIFQLSDLVALLGSL